MSDIISISDAVRSSQLRTQNALSVQAIKQAAAAQKALADMLAENAKNAQAAQERSAKGGISIYV